MVADNRKKGLSNVSKYLYILLLTIRKLKKYEITKKSDFLYRCIGVRVKYYDDNSVNKKVIPYKKGNYKTFWAFTSTSYDYETARTFLTSEGIIKTIKTGTLWSICGKAWGYDITLFNSYPEKEVLLEPERKYYIDEVIVENELVYIRCEVLDSPIVLKDTYNLQKYEHFLKRISEYFKRDVIEKYKTKKINSQNNKNFDEFLDDIYVLLLELSVRGMEEWPFAREELQQNKLSLKFEKYGIKEEMIIKTTLQEEKTEQLFYLLDEKIRSQKKKYEIFVFDNNELQGEFMHDEYQNKNIFYENITPLCPKVYKIFQYQKYTSYKELLHFKYHPNFYFDKDPYSFYYQSQKQEQPFSDNRISKLLKIIELIGEVYNKDSSLLGRVKTGKKNDVLYDKDNVYNNFYHSIFNYKLFFILNICYICFLYLEKKDYTNEEKYKIIFIFNESINFINKITNKFIKEYAFTPIDSYKPLIILSN